MFYPYGNPHSNETLYWGAEPRYRGTYSILSSCIITIALCVWTAVHLNVPEHGRVMPQFWRKIKWMLIGLFAPELVAWTAYQQLQEAKRIRDKMRKLLGQPPVPSTTTRMRQKLATLVKRVVAKRSAPSIDDLDLEEPGFQDSESAARQPWTLTHGHYLAMGGFAVDVSDAPYIFPPDTPTTRFLLLEGMTILFRLRPELIPDLSELEIRDKSKANGFAKTLVCLQALWFCTQIIVRTASRLTISILELNTFAHALCTLLIYLLWWDKPLDITEPTIIRGEAAHPAIALLSVLQDWLRCTTCSISPKASDSNANVESHYRIERQSIPIKVRFSLEHYYPTSIGDKTSRARESYNADVPVPYGFIRVWLNEYFPGSRVMVYQRGIAQLPSGSTALTLPSTTAKKLELAQRAYDQFHDDEKPESRTYYKDCLTDRVPNAAYPDEDGEWLHFFTGISIAGVIYGGLHLSAWGAPMSHVIRMLWRISSIVVASTGVMWLPIQCYIKLDSAVLKNEATRGEILYYIGIWRKEIERVMLTYMAALAVVYAAARIFLVVECFINVRHLPASTFEVPTWSQYFPHIS